jgi:hypothetical protein
VYDPLLRCLHVVEFDAELRAVLAQRFDLAVGDGIENM